jgi:hypothetical protein
MNTSFHWAAELTLNTGLGRQSSIFSLIFFRIFLVVREIVKVINSNNIMTGYALEWEIE